MAKIYPVTLLSYKGEDLPAIEVINSQSVFGGAYGSKPFVDASDVRNNMIVQPAGVSPINRISGYRIELADADAGLIPAVTRFLSDKGITWPERRLALAELSADQLKELRALLGIPEPVAAKPKKRSR